MSTLKDQITAIAPSYEAAIETLTREARELASDAAREDIEREVNEALVNDPHGEFAKHFFEVLLAEQFERDLAGGWAREPLPASATADQQEAVIEQAASPDLELEDGPEFEDDGPSYG